MHRIFGLLGYPLSHSFSQRYFTEKFAREGISGAEYRLFELEQLTHQSWGDLLCETGSALVGLNVTIPWKVKVLDYLDALDPAAEAIGAVNCIHFGPEGSVGYNTDALGFRVSLEQFIGTNPVEKALVLGSGGASKAVCYVLKQLGIPFDQISRKSQSGMLDYKELEESTVRSVPLIINTTPLGMYPEVENYPPIPYTALTSDHYLYDLVYNPAETRFLALGKARGCKTMNGLGMLYAQAEAAWKIWNPAHEATK